MGRFRMGSSGIPTAPRRNRRAASSAHHCRIVIILVVLHHCRIVIISSTSLSLSYCYPRRGCAVITIVSVPVLKKRDINHREGCCSFPSLLPPLLLLPPPSPSLMFFKNKHHAPSAAGTRRTHSARREPRAVLSARNSNEKPHARAQKKRRFPFTIP